MIHWPESVFKFLFLPFLRIIITENIFFQDQIFVFSLVLWLSRKSCLCLPGIMTFFCLLCWLMTCVQGRWDHTVSSRGNHFSQGTQNDWPCREIYCVDTDTKTKHIHRQRLVAQCRGHLLLSAWRLIVCLLKIGCEDYRWPRPQTIFLNIACNEGLEEDLLEDHSGRSLAPLFSYHVAGQHN